MTKTFARRAATDARLLTRSVEGLLGICAGFLADDYLSDDEIRYLDHWLKDHSELSHTFPGEIIAARVREVMKDGRITEEERAYLKKTLQDLLGGTLHQTGATSGLSTKLPLDEGIEVMIPNRSFCFTGQFIFGTRAACERAITSRGGTAAGGIRKDLSYLVIGALASHEWAHTSFGRKIEKAMEYKALGCPIYIVSEDAWAQSVS